MGSLETNLNRIIEVVRHRVRSTQYVYMPNHQQEYLSMSKSMEDLELDSDLLKIINELVRPLDLPRLSIRGAILSALPEIGMSQEDQDVIKEWLGDVEAGRM